MLLLQITDCRTVFRKQAFQSVVRGLLPGCFIEAVLPVLVLALVVTGLAGN